MKVKIRQFFRWFINSHYERKYKARYSNKQSNVRLWDGSRDGLCELVQHLIKPVIKLSTEKKTSFILPPSFQTSVHKNKIEKCETFARSFIGAAYLLNAKSEKIEENSELKIILNYYRNGILEAVTPGNRLYWGKSNHLLLENTSIIIGLLVCRDSIWSSYSNFEKKLINSYFATYIDEPCYRNNWLWCKVFHLAFLELNTEIDHSIKIKEILNDINQMHLGNGWYTDGHKSDGGLVDYYSAWTFQYYGLIFSKYFATKYPKEAGLLSDSSEVFASSYEDYFTIGGTHPIFGRSQLYKFAALSPFGYLLNSKKWKPKSSYPYLRYSFVDEINIFLKKGGESSDGFITMGVTSPEKEPLEHYSASGSPYWAFKAFSLLLVDSNHPFWQESPLKINSKEKIITLPHCSQMLMHDGKGSVLLADLGSYHDLYKWKYNKFIYSNITSRVEDNRVFNFDNSIWFNRGKMKFFIGEVLESKCENGHGSVMWKPKNLPDLHVKTDLIAMYNGYVFIHQILAPSLTGRININLSGFGVNQSDITFSTNERKGVSLTCKTDPSYNSLLELSYITPFVDCLVDTHNEKTGIFPTISMKLNSYTCISGICAKNVSVSSKNSYQFSKCKNQYLVNVNGEFFTIKNIENYNE